MQRSKYDLWVGLFVMLGIVSIVFLALKVGNLINLSFDKTYTVDAEFSDLGSIRAGSPVKSAGIVVGRVRQVTLDARSNQAIATLELQSQYGFPSDSSLRIMTSGLLGEEYIAISAGVEATTLEAQTQAAMSASGKPLLVTRTQPSIALSDLVSQILPGSDGNMPLLGETYTIGAKFNNVGTLKVGSAVKSAGVIVGRVRAIAFDTKQFEAVVTLEMQSKYAFPSDSSLKIASSGLIGGQYVAVSAGPDLDEQTWEEATKAAQSQTGEPFIVMQTQSAIVLEDLIGQFLYNMAADKGSGNSGAEGTK